MSQYVIAVRYDFGDAAAVEVKQQEVWTLLQNTEGVSVVGGTEGSCLLIETTPEIIGGLRATLGDSVWIEDPIPHFPVSSPFPPPMP